MRSRARGEVMVRRHRIGAEQEPEPELWEGGESGRYQGTTGGSSVSPALAPHVMLIPLKKGGNRLSGETVTALTELSACLLHCTH